MERYLQRLTKIIKHKKMKKLSLLFCFMAIMTMSAQEKISKNIGDFSDLKVFDGISVNLIKSDENKAVISGEDADKVAIVNNNGTLKIRMEINKIFSGHKTFVEVYYKRPIDVIDANENAFISSSEPIKQVDIELKTQEGGEIDVTLEVQKLSVKAVTGGQIETKGTAVNQEISINTGGQYEGDALKTQQTTVSVNAGGTAYVNASEYVDAKVKAGGTVRIYGKPKVIDQQKFLGGKIIEQ